MKKMISAVTGFYGDDRAAGGRAEGPTTSEACMLVFGPKARTPAKKKLEILKYTVKKVGDF